MVAQLTWVAVPGATGYSVQRKRGVASFTTIGAPTTNSYLDSTSADQDSYRVATVNQHGTGAYSGAVTYTLPPLGAGLGVSPLGTSSLGG